MSFLLWWISSFFFSRLIKKSHGTQLQLLLYYSLIHHISFQSWHSSFWLYFYYYYSSMFLLNSQLQSVHYSCALINISPLPCFYHLQLPCSSHHPISGFSFCSSFLHILGTAKSLISLQAFSAGLYTLFNPFPIMSSSSPTIKKTQINFFFKLNSKILQFNETQYKVAKIKNREVHTATLSLVISTVFWFSIVCSGFGSMVKLDSNFYLKPNFSFFLFFLI